MPLLFAIAGFVALVLSFVVLVGPVLLIVGVVRAIRAARSAKSAVHPLQPGEASARRQSMGSWPMRHSWTWSLGNGQRKRHFWDIRPPEPSSCRSRRHRDATGS